MTFDPTLVAGPEPLAQHGIGVVAPFDFALDRELWRWTPDDVSLFMTRLPYVPVPVTVEMAAALSDHSDVRRATRDVLAPEPLAVAYACASGSFIHGKAGELALRQTMLTAGAPTAATTSGSLIESLALLDISRIAVVTPYIEAVTDRLLSYLGEYAIDVVSSVGMGLLSHIWKVGYGDIISAVSSVDRPEAEAVFISCTNVPTYDIIAPLEQLIGKPVLTANQVTMCSALRAMGRSAAGPGQSLIQLTQMSQPTAT